MRKAKQLDVITRDLDADGDLQSLLSDTIDDCPSESLTRSVPTHMRMRLFSSTRSGMSEQAGKVVERPVAASAEAKSAKALSHGDAKVATTEKSILSRILDSIKIVDVVRYISKLTYDLTHKGRLAAEKKDATKRLLGMVFPEFTWKRFFEKGLCWCC
jgi:hypothetical protein